jgi:hypothetical protein
VAELKPDMEDNIKSSFSRAREHVKLLEKEVKANREFLIKQNEQISFILSKISQISEENDKISRILASFDTKSSIGNKGVINNHQQSSTVINHQQSSTINTHQQSTTADSPQNQDPKPLGDLKREIEERFLGLTDREFSVFLAVYQLEEELGQVTYSDVANALNITEITARCYFNNLIAKNLPVEKKRLFNRKTILSINKEFRNLNLAGSLLTLRDQPSSFNTQKRLSDLF